MKTKSAFLLAILLSFGAFPSACAGMFQINKITKNLISSPGFTFVGAEQFVQNLRDKWWR